MTEVIFKILTIVGSLGFFMFGMKMMSDGIQRAAGSQLRNVLRVMTRNRFLGVVSGLATTAIVQSSSATTVMTVSFVNAGLLTLVESAGVMMGANVGTTITGWIISILGFEIQLSAYSLPLIAFGVPMIFSARDNLKHWGEFVLGVAVLFLGLTYLKDSVPNVGEATGQLNFLSQFTEWGIFSRILFVLLGTIITIVVQSSTAAMLVTLTLCYQGWLPLDIGAAMILGENIGTTITAEVAALVGNTAAKRSARIHSLFNIVGVCWMIIIMPWVLSVLTTFVENSMNIFEGHISVQAEATHSNKLTTFTLVAFHTVFNLLNVLICLPFVSWLVKGAMVTVKADDSTDDMPRLKFIGAGVRSAELATVELQKETAHFGEIAARMNMDAKLLSNSLDAKERKKLLKKIKKYEKITDKLEIEITEYITKLSNQAITSKTSRRLRSILNICNDLERIGDIYYQVSKTIQQKAANKTYFTPDQRNNLNEMFDLVEKGFEVMSRNLNNPHYEKVDKSEAVAIEKQINKLRNQYRKHNLSRLGDADYNVNSAMVYNNIFSALEKVGDHMINVTEAIAGEI